jgi:starvation-inducible outer membrane lipoprotein
MKYLLIATMALVLSACGMMPERSVSSSDAPTYSESVHIPDTGNGD